METLLSSTLARNSVKQFDAPAQPIIEDLTSVVQELLLAEISNQMQQASNQGHYVLPKAPQQLQSMLSQGQLQALLAEDKVGKIHFLASCGYIELGYNSDGNPVIELGALISNKGVTVDNVKSGEDRILVSPISLVSSDQTFAVQAIGLTIRSIQLAHSTPIIIATSRSFKSQLALIRAGFTASSWTDEMRVLSCDPTCKGVIGHKNCHFGNKEFNQISQQSGCHLMIYNS